MPNKCLFLVLFAVLSLPFHFLYFHLIVCFLIIICSVSFLAFHFFGRIHAFNASILIETLVLLICRSIGFIYVFAFEHFLIISLIIRL